MIGLILIICGAIGLWGTIFKTPLVESYFSITLKLLLIAVFVSFIFLGTGAIELKGA